MIHRRHIATLTLRSMHATSLAASLLISLPASAAPVISWEPSSITETIRPGQTKTIPLLFTASADLANVVLRTVPALKELVQVTPSSIALVQKGTTVHLTLTVSAATGSVPAITQGTIHVMVGKATVAKPFPVLISVAESVSLPPDPGLEGTLTAAGIDSDNDGLRDDLQRFIVQQYPNTYLFAASKYVRALQGTLLIGEATPEIAGNAINAAVGCLFEAIPDSLTRQQLMSVLFGQTLNTELRTLAYISFERALRTTSLLFATMEQPCTAQ